MPTSNQGWPEAFGFKISGNGPCYILAVEEGSSAHAAGLQLGDQILEIEGQPVSSMSCEALISLARQCENVPPSIGVVSRIQQMDLKPGPDGKFGFNLMCHSGSPLQVESVVPESPACERGIKPGDYVLEINGLPVKFYEVAAAMIQSCQGKALRLGLLRLGRLQRWGSSSVREFVQSADAIHQERKQKAQEFSKKVGLRGQGWAQGTGAGRGLLSGNCWKAGAEMSSAQGEQRCLSRLGNADLCPSPLHHSH